MIFSFNIGNIPVRVHPSFLFLILIFGSGGGSFDPQGILIFAGAVFTGVLAHELAHALVGKTFGLTPEIDLHGMGGVTSWPEGRAVGNWRSIAISLAGPLTGIAIGGLVHFYALHFPPSSDLVDDILGQVFFVNFWWGVFNLLPVLPMDGGNVMRAFLHVVTHGRGEKPARIISIVLAVGLGLFAVLIRWWFSVAMAALFAYQNYVALKGAPEMHSDATIREELKHATEALQRDDGEAAARHARFVLAESGHPGLRKEAMRLLAYALLLNGAWGPLMRLMETDGRAVLTDEELAKFERAAFDLGRPEEAGRIRELRGGRGGAIPKSQLN